MALLISGLKLPKKGRYSTVTIYWDGRVVFKFGGAEAGQAIEIPPHGRLVDVSVAYDKIAEAAGEGSGNYVDMDVVDRGLSETPTIIEAEE